MSGTPPRIRTVCRLPGADNEGVYADLLGLSARDLENLAGRGIL